jgi:hypothetical protein
MGETMNEAVQAYEEAQAAKERNERLRDELLDSCRKIREATDQLIDQILDTARSRS